MSAETVGDKTGSTGTQKKHITKAMRLLWGMGEFGESLQTGVSGNYGTYFITNVVGVTPVVYAVVTQVMSIINFIKTPFYGVMVDGIKPMKWGKLRSWLIIGPLACIIFSPFVFINWGIPLVTIIVIRTMGTIQSMFYGAQVTANAALIPSMCAYDDEAASLYSNRMVYASLGRMFAGFIGPTLVMALQPILGNNVYITLHVPFVASMFLCYLVIFKLSEGYEGNGATNEKVAEERLTIKEMMKAVAAVPAIVPLMIADVTSTLGSFLLPALIIYMFRYVIEGGTKMEFLPIYNLMVGIVGTIGAYTVRWIAKPFKDKRTWLLIDYIPIAILCFATRFFMGNVYHFMIVVALMTFFVWCNQPIETAMYYDCALIAESKMGKNPIATFLALSQYAPGFSGIINGIVMSWLFVAIDFNAARIDSLGYIPENVVSGFTNAFSLVNCVIPIIGWLALFLFYKITPKRIEEARAQIVANAKAAEEGAK
jgi:GPH family glycoside/pentoside/hexuronide:cation symporter